MGILGIPAKALGGVLDPIENFIKNPFSTGLGKGQGPDFPRGFEIYEILNGVETDYPTIALRGNMMPMVPFEFGGEQRLSKEYYPGHPEPAVHVQGAKEGNTAIKGKLKDKRFGNGAYAGNSTDGTNLIYGTSYLVSQELDKIRLRGNLLKLVLGNWTRYGFLEKTEFKLNRLSEVEYNLDFFIIGFNRPTNGKIVTKDKEVPFDINTELLEAVDDFEETYSNIPESVPRSIADLMNDAISDVAGAIKVVTGFVDTVIGTVEDIQKSINRAIGVIKNARSSISRYNRRIGAISTGFASLSNDARAAAQFKSAIRAQSHLVNSMSAANTMASMLAAMQRQFEAIAKTVPIARYKTKNGDTLQKVAMKYYGASDNWNKIYDHNKLSSTTLAVGTLLEIPRL